MGTLRKDKMAILPPKFELIGRLYKGGKKRTVPSKKKPGEMVEIFGEDLDHFRFEPVESSRSIAAPEGGMSLYDFLLAQWGKCREDFRDYRSIPVLLPYRSIEQNFPWDNQIGVSTPENGYRCIRKCDGSICSRYQIEVRDAKGRLVKKVITGAIACSMGEDDDECPEGCKSVGELSMFIPALGYPGLIRLGTKSTRDIKTILANLKAYEHFDLSAIPFRLNRTLQPYEYENPQGQMERGEKWFCSLAIDSQYGLLALEAQQQNYRAQLLGGSPAAALPGVTGIKALPETRQPDFRSTDAWNSFEADVRVAIAKKSIPAVAKAVNRALALVDSGVLPPLAEHAIDREQSRALEIIQASPLGGEEEEAIDVVNVTVDSQEFIDKDKVGFLRTQIKRLQLEDSRVDEILKQVGASSLEEIPLSKFDVFRRKLI